MANIIPGFLGRWKASHLHQPWNKDLTMNQSIQWNVSQGLSCTLPQFIFLVTLIKKAHTHKPYKLPTQQSPLSSPLKRKHRGQTKTPRHANEAWAFFFRLSPGCNGPKVRDRQRQTRTRTLPRTSCALEARNGGSAGGFGGQYVYQR